MLHRSQVTIYQHLRRYLGMLVQTVFSGMMVTNCFAADDWLDLVRVEAGQFSREIVYQQKLEQWQSPVSLTRDSRTDDFTPVSIRTASNSTLVLWKESIGVDASSLRYCLIEFDNDGNVSNISDIDTVKTETSHQSSPTLIRDESGQIWSFWVAFNGKDDDIFFSRFNNNRWTKEQRLFDKDNGVPDLRPSARLNVTGALELRWRQFSFDKGDYIDVFSTLVQDDNSNTEKWAAPEVYVVNPLEKIPRLPVDFALPDGVSQPDTVAINFAGLPNLSLHWNTLPAAADSSPPKSDSLN